MDHPRSRGVYSTSPKSVMAVPGSSPLARGLLLVPVNSQVEVGIIPARAGFTCGRTGRGTSPRDHPRSRGVYRWFVFVLLVFVGSSPLARGLRSGDGLSARLGGIIPARAGFTRHHQPEEVRVQDHPRSRGVYSDPDTARGQAEGSSPLARGLRQAVAGHGLHEGIIPARAGFTKLMDLPGWARPDHPRSRGVYKSPQNTCPDALGSSPLARGLRKQRRAPRRARRIIPARAGFTVSSCGRVMGRGDHPRSRGVYEAFDQELQVVVGSSPLARGLRRPEGPRRGSRRIIPARAGFTLADPWNPNDEAPYQTAFAFTADLALAPQSSDSVVVLQQSTRTPSEP